MYKYWKLRERIASIVSMFYRTKTSRRRIRDYIRFRGILKTVGENKLPIKRPEKNINIAFCFDDNGYKLCAVAIKSLLNASRDRCDYDIYCVVDDGVTTAHRKIISNLTRGTNSKVKFLTANHDFDQSYRAAWPIAVFYRTMLPKLLPNIDTIIYADIDIIFCRDLIEISNIDMGTHILAGVPDYKNGYLNSGFLIMNLKQIHDENMYKKWIEVSRKKKYKNPDQDLLNFTTRGRNIFLPLRYNFQPMLGKWIFRAHCEMEIDDLAHNLVVLHFSNWMKPWHDEHLRPIFSHYWWRAALDTGLF